MKLSVFFQVEKVTEQDHPNRQHESKKIKENFDEFVQDNFKKIDIDMDGIVTIKEFEKVRDEL